MKHPIIIIGAGLSGYQTAREFRKIDTISRLMLVTADDGQFYPKPQLSTALTSGKTPDALVTTTAQDMAQQLNADIITNSIVTTIDPIKKIIQFRDQEIFYEKLVLACGADVIKPPLKGDAVQDVISINHLYHYSDFRDRIRHKKKIAILGAGLIGCEFANDLSNVQYQVDVIAPAQAPLDLLIPENIGKLLQNDLEKNGVHFHLNCIVDEINKTASGYSLNLSNGEKITTDLVISAIGLKPHIALAEKAGIQVNKGILVNSFLETSRADIYALGDCAEVEGHVLPYIAPILQCARALANTLAGTQTAVEYPAMPVMVKTPAHPIAICPPPKNTSGNWVIEKQGENIRAFFYNEQHQLLGFVLTRDAVKERNSLAKQLPKLF